MKGNTNKAGATPAPAFCNVRMTVNARVFLKIEAAKRGISMPEMLELMISEFNQPTNKAEVPNG